MAKKKHKKRRSPEEKRPVRYRSTENGRFVTKAFRKKNKKTTVKVRLA